MGREPPNILVEELFLEKMWLYTWYCYFSGYTHMLFMSSVHADADSGTQLGKKKKKAHFGKRRPS